MKSYLRLGRLSPEMHSWWLALCLDGRITGYARTLLSGAQRRLEEALRPHMAVRMLAGALYDRLSALDAPPGLAGAAVAQAHGTALEESALLSSLTEVAAGRRSMDTYLRAHGFHGPSEGDLASRSWREDPEPLLPLLDKLQPPPRARTRDAHDDPDDATRAFLHHFSPARRPPARLLIRATRHFTLLGEQGKACFLRALDGMRWAARQRGQELLAAGVLDDPEDVFYLTEQEAFSATLTAAGASELCALRREQHADFALLYLPSSWIGPPDRQLLSVRTDGRDTDIVGVSASGGTVSGTVRVIDDPSAGDLNDGEILVARFTDPSWTPLMSLATGLVIDIGGPMSHGAVIARELGIPCVIGTGDGTRRLKTGDTIEVDGTAGVVRWLLDPPG